METGPSIRPLLLIHLSLIHIYRLFRLHTPESVLSGENIRVLGETPSGNLLIGTGHGLSVLEQKDRSEEHTSELQSRIRISYAVFCLKKKRFQKSSINDRRYDNGGFNTLAVVYNYKRMKYEVLVVSDEKVGDKEIHIL